MPTDDYRFLKGITAEEVHLVGSDEGKDGYLSQQVSKMYADEFCGAEYVLHVDSDCVFTKPCTPESFFHGGKPAILREEGVDSPWPKISVNTLGWYDGAEYMRRLPIIYPRWAYGEFRKYVKDRQGVELRDWIMHQSHRAFSEFNTMGQFLYKTHQEDFAWCHPSAMDTVAKQWWSWGGLSDEIRKEIEEILA